jgi:hypothetical protein
MNVPEKDVDKRLPWVRAQTYCGARPNNRAENTRDMTPKKKLILSRVRTTLADCHAAASDPMRVDTCKGLELG